MKNPKTQYWIVTGLMAAFIVLSAVPDILRIPGAVDIFRHLGYPIVSASIPWYRQDPRLRRGSVPRLRRLKEWAYAGLFIDLTGALYSHLSVGDPPSAWILAVIGLILVSGSYLAYRRLPNIHGESSRRYFRIGEYRLGKLRADRRLHGIGVKACATGRPPPRCPRATACRPPAPAPPW